MEIKVIRFAAITDYSLEEKLNQIPGRVVSVVSKGGGDWIAIYEDNQVEPEAMPAEQ